MAPDPTAAAQLLEKPNNLAAYERLAAGQPPVVAAFWKYLLLCFETPRPSTNFQEPDDPKRLDKIRDVLKGVATHLGAQAEIDVAGNLILRKEGRGRGAGKPWLCLQGHLDIVCSQNEGAGHDFERDGIEVRFTDDDSEVGGWLKPVKATTLGADNGVGLAGGLAMMEALADHPPLELLFTVNEETDFAGAEGLQPGTLQSKRLLNLDSEEEYAICVGCAGGFEHKYLLPVDYTGHAADMVAVSVQLRGLQGGHSGADIHREHGNAITLLTRLMLSTTTEARLAHLRGGTGPSAIPREAACVVLMPIGAYEGFCADLQKEFGHIRQELNSVEKFNMEDGTEPLQIDLCHEGAPADLLRRVFPARPLAAAWRCSRCPRCQAVAIAAQSAGESGAVPPPPPPPPAAPAAVPPPPPPAPPAAKATSSLSPASTRKVWQFCASVPHGVLRRSTEVADMVESSVNFGIVELKEGRLMCHLLLRSSISTYMEHARRMLASLGHVAGAENVENINPFAPWEPKLDSPLLSVLQRTHGEVFEGRQPRIYSIHAGLECGTLMQAEPQLDCMSIGPRVEGAHSPDERIHIASGVRYVTWLQRILEALAKDE